VVNLRTTPNERLSFEEVYAAHQVAVTRLAYLVVRSPAIAEDLAQEAFTGLYQRFAEVDNPPGYLRISVAHLAVRWQDRHQMEQRRLATVGALPDPVTPEIDETWDAIGRLRPERRTVLVLRFYEDLSYDEIAALLGCSAGTVRSRVRRALADLRKDLNR
jgi:RNA polymerase sigma factor (sigma-70 family)